jgi:hypothetical protein
MTRCPALHVASLAALALAVTPGSLAAQDSRASVDTTSTASSMATALAPSMVSHRATRMLVARSEKLNKMGWLEVETTFRPESGFTYSVLREGGDAGIRRRVLFKVLDKEAELSVPAQARLAALSDANYQLTPGATRQTVRLVPRRRDTALIDGTAVIDTRGALSRIEGRLAKSPSFWVRSVTIQRKYQSIAGHALPVLVESTADVKLAGTCDFAMWIEYSDVDGQQVAPAARHVQQSSVAPAPLLVALQQQLR